MLSRIHDQVMQYPERICYKVDNECMTYRELWEKAERTADLLQKEGTSPVILYGHKQTYMVLGIMACLLAGRTYVPVGACSPVQRVEMIAEKTGSSLVITDQEIQIKGKKVCRIEDLEQYRNEEKKECKAEIAYIIFTSGSTGEPKGVPVCRENLENFIHWIGSLEPLNAYRNEVVLNQASFSFDLSVADLYYTLCGGHTLIAYNDQAYEDLFRLFREERIGITVMTPTFIKLFLLNKEFDHVHYPDYKCAYFCGERLENKTVKELLERFPDLQVLNAYGPTEAASAVSAIRITPKILQEEEILPVGEMESLASDIVIEEDEIVIKGPSVFHGYLGSLPGGYYCEQGVHCFRTGDIGYVRDGKLYCRGRKDSQVKYKGYRIELMDIENNVAKIHGVQECVTVAKYNEDGIVKTIKAFVKADEGVTAEYVKEELGKVLPGYMMPKTIRIMKTFPVNENGKTDRKAMSQL